MKSPRLAVGATLPATGLAIRRGARREIPQIVSVMEAAYAQYRGEVPPALFGAYLEDLRQLSVHWGEAQVLVAELDGRIAGSVLFYADASSEGLGLPRGWAGFRKLAVHPALRGRGLGRSLTEHCVEMADRVGVSAVGIHTASFMTAACRIYEQLGFRRCPEHDLRARDIVGVDAAAGEVTLIAYRLGLVPSQRRAPE